MSTRHLYLLPALGLAACAGTPPPTAEMAAAQATVEQVEPAALRHAPEHLRIAQQKLDRAEAAMADEDYERARRLAEQAEVDARLAGSVAESEQSQQALAEVKQSIETLKQQIDRRTQ